MTISASKAYHLGLSRGDVSGVSLVFLVGDPGRVSLFEPFLEKVEVENARREFISVVGIYRGKRVLALSTGIGPDNIEIAVTELAMLGLREIPIIRIGTCGIIQKNIPPGSFIFSEFAAGIDNLPFFYEGHARYFHSQLTEAVKHLFPVEGYGVKHTLAGEIPDWCFRGITITAPGFYAPQGRNALEKSRMPPVEELARVEFNGFRFLNFEMECAFLYFISSVAGFRAGTFCVGIFNRQTGEGLAHYKEKMEELIGRVLEWSCGD